MKLYLNFFFSKYRTALHEAISFQQISCFKLLLSNNADVTIKNDDGDDPKALALKCGIPESSLDAFFGLFFDPLLFISLNLVH